MKKRSRLEKFLPYVLGACMLTFVAACGSDDDDDNNNNNQQEQEQDNQGSYRVTFSPLNTTVAGTTVGTGTIEIDSNDVDVNMTVTGAPAYVKHSQHVHVGTSCPNMGDDSNGDGILDDLEGSSVYDDIIIPLDSSLSTQTAGAGNYPTASSSGTYTYSESADLNVMLADLMLPDLDTDDNVIKLGVGDDLNLAGKVIVIHGISSAANLPATVQSQEDEPGYKSLPIACGVITREVTGSTTGSTTGGTTGSTTGGTTGSTTGGTTGSTTGGTTGGTTGDTTGGTTGSTTGGTTGATTGGVIIQ